jgi:phosphatidate cytidylyltransferase
VSNLAARLLTAFALIPLLLAAIFWSNPIGVFALVFAASGIGLREWLNMTMPQSTVAERVLGVTLGLAISLHLGARGDHGLAIGLAASTLIAFVWLLLRYGDVQTVASRFGAMMSGILYVPMLLIFVALLKMRGSDGGFWVLLTLTLVWFSDTGAYFAGRFLGPTFPRKLYEAMSPKKTVVGALGGVCASCLAVTLAKLYYLHDLRWIDLALLAVPANLLGQVGDLAESMLKRSVGVKDSGALLPGHGGMLDRIDALLFAAPYVFAYASYFYPVR